MNFQILSPNKVLFGTGTRREIGRESLQLGQRAILVCGSRSLQATALWQEIESNLAAAGIEIVYRCKALREPTIADVDENVAAIRDASQSADFVIAIGGGAALDLGKAISAILPQNHGTSIRDYLEGVGTGLTLDRYPLPVIALPTTAGTGSEATKNAVISVDSPYCKKSLRSEKMIPQTVIIDPELTLTVPPKVTAESGMDAITQLLESYISRRANSYTKTLCVEGLKYALPHIETAYTDGDNLEARTAMAYAAYLSGVSLANSGLGMAHGVAAALGAICNVSHGLACAVMLPIALRTNLEAVGEELAILSKELYLTDSDSSSRSVASIQNKIQNLCELLEIPSRLDQLGVEESQIEQIALGSRGNSMNGNPKELTDQELITILKENL